MGILEWGYLEPLVWVEGKVPTLDHVEYACWTQRQKYTYKIVDMNRVSSTAEKE